MKSFGIGIVGTGSVAGAHIETFRQIAGCRVVGVCSRDRARAQAKIATHGLADPQPHDDLGEMLARRDIDIVVLCTPHPNHPHETIAAARAGKHVVIEKPVALDRAALREMLAVVQDAGVQTSVCFELRWIGLFRNIKALIADGVIGTPFHGETGYFHAIGPWYPQYEWNRQRALGGDALLTAGCHALDGLIWLLGSEVVEVSAFANTSAANPLRFEYDANVTAILRFASGAIGKVATSVECRQPYLFPVLVQGDRGTIWNDRVASLAWPGLPADRWAQIPAAVPDSGDVAAHPYRGQMEYFVQCLRDGRRPHNDLASCAHTHDVMFAIQDAIARRAVVAVEPTAGSAPLWE